MAAGVLRPSACQPKAGDLDPQSLASQVLGLGSNQAQCLILTLIRPHCLVVFLRQHFLELEHQKRNNRETCITTN
jgi:hypothetical protein